MGPDDDSGEMKRG